jgi:hypothetical protein
MTLLLVCITMNVGWIVFENSLKKKSISFGEIHDYFVVIKFQASQSHIIMGENVPWFGVPTNENIQHFVDKYLTTNQTIFERWNLKLANTPTWTIFFGFM